MKLKNYIIIGYVVSALITITAVLWAMNLMLIEKKDIYFIISITIAGAAVGAVVSLFLLSKVFTSLKLLKKQTVEISEKRFDYNTNIKNPTEFRELSTSFNEMSKKLKETFDSLEESEKEKNLMIAQLSHDIKTPITSIQATVEGMIDGVIKDEEKNYYLKTIARQTARLNTLVEELNALTISTNSQENTKNEEVLLDKLLIDCLAEFQLQAEKENRKINIKVVPENAKVITNYNKVLRIVVNFISNAFKYSESGEKIEIFVNATDDNVKISVVDRGIGIKKEDFDKIFTRLYRVESSRNLGTGGYGLGLAIAKQLALSLNGKIEVKSELRKGSTFTLIIPKNI